MESSICGLTLVRNNPNQPVRASFLTWNGNKQAMFLLEGNEIFQTESGNMFTTISLNSRSKCDSWSRQHIFKWHVSSQNIHTNTTCYTASQPGTDISFCPSPSAGRRLVPVCPKWFGTDKQFPLNVFQCLETRHIFPTCILPRDTSVCSEFAFSISQNTPNCICLHAVLANSCSRCLSLRLRNVTSPCLAIILAIWDLA